MELAGAGSVFHGGDGLTFPRQRKDWLGSNHGRFQSSGKMDLSTSLFTSRDHTICTDRVRAKLAHCSKRLEDWSQSVTGFKNSEGHRVCRSGARERNNPRSSATRFGVTNASHGVARFPRSECVSPQRVSDEAAARLLVW